MRILQIRFKNLNSLVGEWAIDLTHPAFASDGIFAITGPTGAGKTTLLDAICLALYGRTPRLNKVSKGSNEIMSRQTGECFAEVTFETQAGRYRCHWSQRRAHKKPGGELQSPRHEIAYADSGQIVETKSRGVAEQIEAVTGMDFDRFTRSMLLAQGGFAVFLQASPDERAPILEQITGTHIYSQISVRVHERRSEERKNLESLSSELAGMQLLSQEEEGRLSAGLGEKIEQDEALAGQAAEKSRSMAWLEGMAKLEQELKEVAERKMDWQRRQEDFAPTRDKLQRAMKALELAGEHAALKSVRREQETDRQNHQQCLERLPQHEEEVKMAEAAVKQAIEELEAKKAEQKERLLTIRKTRELDLRIVEKEALIRDAGSGIAEREKSLESLCSSYSENGALLDKQRKALDGVLQFLNGTENDESLVEHLAGLREKGEALKKVAELHSAKTEALKAAERQQAEHARLWKERAESLEIKQRELESRQQALIQKRNELKNLLEGRELSEWRSSLLTLSERKLLIDKALEAAQSLAESRAFLDELENRQAGLAADRSLLDERIAAEIARCVSLERETGLLETQLLLLKKIQGFEEARHQLRDGKPCPLCGALEHPFAEDGLPMADESTTALSRIRDELRIANAKVAQLKVKEAETNKDICQIARSREEGVEKITALETLIHRMGSELSVEGKGQDVRERLQQLHGETAMTQERETRLLQAAETIEKEIAVLRESLDHCKETVESALRDTQTAAHDNDSTRHLLERLNREAGDLEAERNQSLSGLLQRISCYGVEFQSIAAIDQILIELAARRDRWLQKQKEKSDLEQNIAELEIRTRHQAEQIRQFGSELEKQGVLLKNLHSERERLSEARRNLFGDLNPDEEEIRLSETLETAEKTLDAFRKALNKSSQELNNLKARMDELTKSVAARAQPLQNEEALFLARLEQLGFSDENGLVEADLPEHERKALLQQARTLDEEQTELTGRERDKTAQMEEEKRKQITRQSREELAQELERLVVCQKELQQEIGGIRQKLKDNEELKQKHRERAQAIEGQKRECSRWDLLHELIGSADGKKYRNFAQGLTFEIMVGHANRQLRKMSDRYLLIRDALQPLELNVVDNYQGGEIRSTKNLSGGECFIVSLALALGLSHMASKNVRVDSLFLDEGFGTLDEEALDTALETLAGLQRGGKLIGIISHVPALKERIGTQIQIIPQTGGRSIIRGPGCARCKAAAEV